jgi:hypothetical protein
MTVMTENKDMSKGMRCESCGAETHEDSGQHRPYLADCPACGMELWVPAARIFHCDGCGAELCWELHIIRTDCEVRSDQLKERIFGERWMTITG